MHRIFKLIFVIVVFSSCNSKKTTVASTQVVENSIQLPAYQPKNKQIIMMMPDTLYVNDKLPKAVVDSINNARKAEYKRLDN